MQRLTWAVGRDMQCRCDERVAATPMNVTGSDGCDATKAVQKRGKDGTVVYLVEKRQI